MGRKATFAFFGAAALLLLANQKMGHDTALAIERNHEEHDSDPLALARRRMNTTLRARAGARKERRPRW